jgi:hypothetical protein
MKNLEQKIIENAGLYQSNPKTQCAATKPGKMDIWYEKIHQHFTNVLQPHIRQTGEMFVEYWPAFFLWERGSEIKQGLINRELVYKHRYGTYSTGYVCITNYNIYIISLDSLTDKFPLYRKGLINFFLNNMIREIDLTRPEREDKTWTIPHRVVLDAQITNDHRGKKKIKLVTAAVIWEIYEHFWGNLDEIQAGLSLVIKGELKKLKPVRHSTKIPERLTEAEFEFRKRKMLSSTASLTTLDIERAWF